MKKYQPQNHITPHGAIILCIGSILIGLANGVLAYFVSQILYFFVIFEFFITFPAAITFAKLQLWTKTRHPILTSTLGMLTGLCIVFAFFYTPFVVARNNFIAEAQKQYHVDTIKASNAFDYAIYAETGSNGFFGFMKLRAREGNEFTGYLVINSLPVYEFSFVLKSTGAWIYWLIESLIMCVLVVGVSFDSKNRRFNKSTNDWYAGFPAQIKSVQFKDKNVLLESINTGDLAAISKLLLPEDDVIHPRIEIYKQESKNVSGDILISVKETWLNEKKLVKRRDVGLWEITREEFATLNLTPE